MKNISILLTLLILISSCGIYKKTDARKVPVNADERVAKNINEGRGFRLGALGKSSGGDFLFASSNPLWRASLEKLNFTPLGVADYGGGIIITEWFGDKSSKDQIKITVRFLTNEIRSDAIDITIHKKNCDNLNNCSIDVIQNSTNNEIKIAILKRASELYTQDIEKKREEVGDYKIPGKKF